MNNLTSVLFVQSFAECIRGMFHDPLFPVLVLLLCLFLGFFIAWELGLQATLKARRLLALLKDNGIHGKEDFLRGGYRGVSMTVQLLSTQAVDHYSWVQTVLVETSNPSHQTATLSMVRDHLATEKKADLKRLMPDWQEGGAGFQIAFDEKTTRVLFQLTFSPRDLYLNRDRAMLIRCMDMVVTCHHALRPYSSILSA